MSPWNRATALISLVAIACGIAATILAGFVGRSFPAYLAVGFGLAFNVIGGIVLADAIQSSRGRHRLPSSRTLRGAARLLPRDAREDCLEEWQAWLLDLREQGSPRYRIILEILSLALLAAPRLAWRLRRSRQRAGD